MNIKDPFEDTDIASSRAKTVELKKPEKPHVNNLANHPLTYCCGGTELGNFNYVDTAANKQMAHFHKIGSWKRNPNENDDPTTLEDIQKKLQYVGSSLIVATTGSGQEYMEPLLTEVGFTHVFTFINPDHADTPVKLWARAKKPFMEKT